MLSKNKRISKKYFPFILKNSKRFNSPHFVLYISENNLKSQSNFSFSISKKICKKAVYRNKYRRQGYSIINKYLNQIKNGFFFFFSFKKSTYPVDFNTLNDEIFSLLSVSHMIN